MAAGQDAVEGVGERRRIGLRDRRAQVVALDHVGQLVAARAYDRQTCPEAVEVARAEREVSLEVLVVGRQRAGGLEQPVDALGVGDPAVVEEHRAVEQPELAGERASFVRRVGGRTACLAHEHQPRARAALAQQRHRADGRLGVEPRPDCGGPQHDLVARVDPVEAHARAALARRDRRLGRRAVGDQVDDRAQRRVALRQLRRQQALGQHRADPQVALALGGAHEVVAGAQRIGHAVGHERRQETRSRRAPARVALQRLDLLGHEEVEDEART